MIHAHGPDRPKDPCVAPDDGRLTLTELARRVGLSVSPCHRRLHELERGGVITGYHADVDPAALGLGFEALVFVTMRQEDRATLQAWSADGSTYGTQSRLPGFDEKRDCFVRSSPRDAQGGGGSTSALAPVRQ